MLLIPSRTNNASIQLQFCILFYHWSWEWNFSNLVKATATAAATKAKKNQKNKRLDLLLSADQHNMHKLECSFWCGVSTERLAQGLQRKTSSKFITVSKLLWKNSQPLICMWKHRSDHSSTRRFTCILHVNISNRNPSR